MDLIKLQELNSSGYTQKEMAKLLGVSRTTVQRNLKKIKLSTPNYHNSIKFDNSVFDIIDTEEKAYWLGFLYADGSVGKTNNNVELSLSVKDISHLEKFKKFLKTPKTIKVSTITVNNKQFERCRLIVTDKHLKQSLIKCGCTPKKSLTITFPNKNIISENLIYPFIRGYVDGDGSITFSKSGRLELLIIGTKEFLETVVEIFPEFHTLKKDKRWKGNTFYISISSDKADTVLTKLYKNASIYLDRKYNRLAVLSSNW